MPCESLPLEIWDMIVHYLDGQTNKALRLANRTLSHLSSGRSFERRFQDYRVELTTNGIQQLQNLVTHPWLGNLVETLTLDVDPATKAHCGLSPSKVDLREPTGATWIMPSRGARETSNNDGSLQGSSRLPRRHSNPQQDTEADTNGDDLLDDEGTQSGLNRRFINSLLQIFEALKSIRKITFWGGNNTPCSDCSGTDEDGISQFSRRWEETVRTYYLTATAIIEARLVVDSFEVYLDSPLNTSLVPALVIAPFLDFGPPASMTSLYQLLAHLGVDEPPDHEYQWEDFETSLTVGGNTLDVPITPKFKIDLSTISSFKVSTFHGYNPHQTRQVFEKIVRCMGFASIQCVYLFDQIYREHDLLWFLVMNPSIIHLELSFVLVFDGHWTPIFDFLATRMPHLQSLTLGFLLNEDHKCIRPLRTWEKLDDFPQLQDRRGISYGRTFDKVDLARGLRFVPPF
ncbi:hypothetical protein N8T08_000355 [Aspergillus melleus]|uniref:Uncharacterized protein n=1 Tax=Aspergillus melleus TaxID=138277 RepID=A0ACC3BAZ6_9EURO|nr:hypothetical protein N8T08_000355 [Aspergillus melleus]